MRRPVSLLASLLLLGAAAGPASAQGQRQEQPPPDTDAERTPVGLRLGGDRLTKRVRSFKELRQEGVVLQKLDYSCGAAAMATLLSGFYGDRISEDEIIGFIFIHGQTPEEGLKKYFRRKGFSLLDLKRFAEFRGYKAAGYKEMTLDDLVEILRDQRVPVLVSVNPFGYSHFVVVQGIVGNRIYLADPAVGKTTMILGRFIDIWVDGIGFVVSKKAVAGATRDAVADADLEKITAAGDGGKPAGASGPATTMMPRPSLLQSGYAVPDLVRLHPVLNRPVLRGEPQDLPVITDGTGIPIMSFARLPRYNPSIGLGRPEGNFIDFTPPPGKPLQVSPQ